MKKTELELINEEIKAAELAEEERIRAAEEQIRMSKEVLGETHLDYRAMFNLKKKPAAKPEPEKEKK